MIRAVTVHAGSARQTPAALLPVARDLGAGIAARGWVLIYGGATVGLMGADAAAASPEATACKATTPLTSRAADTSSTPGRSSLPRTSRPRSPSIPTGAGTPSGSSELDATG